MKKNDDLTITTKHFCITPSSPGSIRSLVALLLVLCSLQQAWTQDANYVWAKSTGGIGADVGQAVTVDAAGNIYLTGYFNGSVDFDPGAGSAILTAVGGQDVFVAKYGPNGTYLWAIKMGGAGADQGVGIGLDGLGSVYVTGRFTMSGDFDPGSGTATLTSVGGIDAFLAKYDTNGNYLWAKGIGSSGTDIGYSLVANSSGSVYVIGTFAGATDFDHGLDTAILRPAGGNDIFIAKYDPNGNYTWAKSMGGTGTDYGQGIAIDLSGNVYVTGYYNQIADFDPGPGNATLTPAGANDIFLAKYDAHGNYIWAKSMGGSGGDQGAAVAVDAYENAYITGRFASSNIDFDPGPGIANMPSAGTFDVFLAKYDKNGNYVWAKSMGGNSADIGNAIALDNTGNIYLTGTFSSTAADFDPGLGKAILATVGESDVFMARYDPQGNYVWAKTVGSFNFEDGLGIAVHASGSIAVTGSFQGATDFDPGPSTVTLSPAGGNDVFLLKLSQDCTLFHNITADVCDSFQLNGRTYTVSGLYPDTFSTSTDCDSIVILDLTISGYTTVAPVVKGHYCDTVTFNGITYNKSGNYIQRYNNHKGCDSNIHYELEIGHNNGSTNNTVACGHFTFNDHTYTETGTYTIPFPNASGCDSTITLELTINSLPVTTVIKNGPTLTAYAADSYYWVNCEDFLPIPGATEQSFTATQSGDYTVILTSSDCTDTSECTSVQIETNIREQGLTHNIAIFPNPVHRLLHFQINKSLKNVDIAIYNVTGQQLGALSQQQGDIVTLDMSVYGAGIYFAAINEDGKTTWVKILKAIN